ncbi:hypothetical protein SB6419_02492 [Klebsiella spallanzanii]|nr:hypothetical protein SB6419_02492 [Klebsiella spallanzanii]
MHTEPHVVIIGGGFSGAAVAIHLLRLVPAGGRVTLLEPRETPGAGVAYSTTEPSHRINVPAARMQLAGEEEGRSIAGTATSLLLLTIRWPSLQTARFIRSAGSLAVTLPSVLLRQRAPAPGGLSICVNRR